MPSTTQKRTRNKVPSNGTLHNFFVRTAPPIQPQQGLQTSAFSRKAAKEQIIVIDSDSDDAIEIVENTSSKDSKRRKLSPKNNHIKGEDLLQANDSTNQISINWKKSSPPNISNTKEESNDSNKINFGKPFLLCSNSVDNTDGDSGSDRGAGLFTLSSSLLGTTPNESESRSKLNMEILDKDGDEVLVDLISSTKNEVLSSTDVSTALNGASGGWDIEFISDDEWPQSESEETVVNAALPGPVSGQLSEKSGNAKGTDAFSVLMTSLKEKEAWREADIAEAKTHRTHPTYARRKAPFYKVLQGMPIAVDAFRYGAIPGVTAYFLSHAHSDHYTTLSSSWKNGPIYCSEGTANLITHMLNVDKKWVRPLPMDTPILVPDTNGVTVTLIEANHCPGSCLFFFEGPQSVNSGDSNFKSAYVGSSRIFRYLHCGDFRASPQHVLHPALHGKTVDHVYLDTTYLDPRYTFPPQPLVISACAELARRIIEGEHTSIHGSSMLSWITSVSKDKVQARTLIVVGTYSIGKERLVKAIAHAVNSKIYCDVRKTAILRCETDPELDVLLTSDPKDSFVHLIPLQTISTDCLKTYLQRFQGSYDKVIGFRPTGWTYSHPGADLSPSISAIMTKASEQNFSYSDLRVSPKSTPTLQLYPVPYSEHSSFSELTCFAMSFSWVKMIATVNVGNESSRAKMTKWVAKWEAERKKRGKDAIVPHRHLDYW